MAHMIDVQRSGAITAKTINNARAALSGALADATRLDLLPRNPCQFVAPLPLEHRELDYLRLAEIDRYLDACGTAYRPIAELLIGTGARISEALALTWPDLDLDQGTVHIHRQQARGGEGTRPPKGQTLTDGADRPSAHRCAERPPRHRARQTSLAVRLPATHPRPLRAAARHGPAQPQNRPRVAPTRARQRPDCATCPSTPSATPPPRAG